MDYLKTGRLKTATNQDKIKVLQAVIQNPIKSTEIRFALE